VKQENLSAPLQIHAELVLNYLLSFYPLSDEFQKQFKSRLFDVKLQKGTYLINYGEICENFYFIIKGIIIGYTPRKNKIITTFICADGDSVSSISGMYGEQPSGESLYVAEDSHLIGLPAKSLLSWLETSIEMNIIIRKILEIFYKDANERSTVVRMGNAREKCDYYFATFPHHNLNRIPAKYIADFLDIKTNTLAKILKEKEGKKEEDFFFVDQLIDAYMIEKMAFKQHGLTLFQMSKDLNISLHSLSYLLNYHYEQSFNAFVNKYRIQYIKKKLQYREEWQHLKIEALGHEGGFSSRSVFFAEFKKYTGLTPAAFAEIYARPKKSEIIRCLNI
jgi:AraC-like DNA-binding protein